MSLFGNRASRLRAPDVPRGTDDFFLKFGQLRGWVALLLSLLLLLLLLSVRLSLAEYFFKGTYFSEKDVRIGTPDISVRADIFSPQIIGYQIARREGHGFKWQQMGQIHLLFGGRFLTQLKVNLFLPADLIADTMRFQSKIIPGFTFQRNFFECGKTLVP